MTKVSEQTQTALTGAKVEQIAKDVTEMKSDFKDFKNARYVTQNEVSLAIKDAIDSLQKENTLTLQAITTSLTDLKGSFYWIRNIGMGALVSFILFIVYAVVKGALKIP